MAQLPGEFNPNAEGQQGVEWVALPAGQYTAQIVASEMVPTKDNVPVTPQGPHFLKLDWKILEGEMAGKTLIQRLNLINPNATAVEIANKHLASICRAMGIPSVSDSNVLHGIPILIKVKQTKETSQYGAGNDITKYEPLGAGIAAAGLPTAAVPVPAGLPTASPVAAATPVVAAPIVAAPAVAAPVAVAPAVPTLPVTGIAEADVPAETADDVPAEEVIPPWLAKK